MPWQKLMAVCCCVLLLIVPLVWLSSTSELFEFNKIIATYLFTVVICGLWIGRMIAERRFIFSKTLLDWPLLVFLGVTLISWLFSIDTHISWYGYYSRWNGGLQSLLAYSVLYWAAVSNLNRKVIPWLTNCLLIGSAIVATYAFLEHFGFSFSCLVTQKTWGVDCWVQDVKNRVFATLGQPNWLAAYFAAIIWVPIAKINFASKKFNHNQVLYIGLSVLLFLVLLFTKSRSGILAYGISALVYWGLQVKSSGKQIYKSLLGFLVVGVVFGLLVPNPIRDLVIKSPSTQTAVGPALEVGGTESGAIRKIVWKGAIKIWQGSLKNMILGTGPETFALSYYQYRPVEHNQTSEWELLYNKAHNEFLNQLATTGVVGLLSYLYLLVVMGWVLVKNYSQAKDADKPLQLALLAGWISLPITNFWGFSTVVTQLLLWLIPALAIINLIEAKEMRVLALSTGQKVALMGVCLGCLYLISLTYRYWKADVQYAAATNALKGFQSTLDPKYLLASYKLFTSSYTRNSAEPAISSELAVTAAYLAGSLEESDATSAASFAEIAVAASDKAISTSPYHPNYYKSRARAMILLSGIDAKYLDLAAQALQKAKSISPTDPRLPFNLGVVQEHLGATSSAILEYQQALELKPDFGDAIQELKTLEK